MTETYYRLTQDEDALPNGVNIPAGTVVRCFNRTDPDDDGKQWLVCRMPVVVYIDPDKVEPV